MSFDFTSSTHGKWILAGEHAVVRKHSALVFPLKSKIMTLRYQENSTTTNAVFDGKCGEDIHLLFWSVIEHGLNLINHSLHEITGQFNLSNNIPIGAGMGASAALCINISRWFIWKNFITEDELFSFARQLEDLFHGESSGLDIAGSLSDTGIFFQDKKFKPLNINWQPKWYLSTSNQIGITSHCIKKVNKLWENNPDLAKKIDNEMQNAVNLAITALKSDQKSGIDLLTNAINQARICFTRWNLTSNALDNHINSLLTNGALAAKPTGSGEGGYILSLWGDTPPDKLLPKLIFLG